MSPRESKIARRSLFFGIVCAAMAMAHLALWDGTFADGEFAMAMGAFFTGTMALCLFWVSALLRRKVMKEDRADA